MKKYENQFMVVKIFRTVLLKYVSDLHINEYYLNESINYITQMLSDPNLPCIIGLSQEGTTILRQKFGFNQDNVAYTYDEISRLFNIKNVQTTIRIAFHNLHIAVSDMDKILVKLKNCEDDLVLKTLLGQVLTDDRIIHCFTIRHIYTLGDLIQLSINDIKEIKGLGNRRVDEIINLVHSYGLKFRNERNLVSKEDEPGNRESCETNFKNVLREKYFSTREFTNFNQKKFEVAFDYLLNSLLDFNTQCIISLSKDETYVLRAYFGFNSLYHPYSYSEITQLTKIKVVPLIIHQVLMRLTDIIDDIYPIKQGALKDKYPLNILIGELNLSSRINSILFSNKIYTIGDLSHYTEDELLKIPKLGQKSVLELITSLSSLGIKFSNGKMILDSQSWKENQLNKSDLWNLKILLNNYQQIVVEIDELTRKKEVLETKISELMEINGISDLDMLDEKFKK